MTASFCSIFNEIELAFTSANAALLDLLMKENDLMSRLRSMKRYFLLDSADFLVQFLDLASEELSKRASDVSQQKLQNLWDLSTGGKTDSFRVEISSKSFLDTVLRIIAKGRLENQQETSDAPRQKIIDPGVVIGEFGKIDSHYAMLTEGLVAI